MTDTTKPRYVCPVCGMVEYCEKSNGMPRYPEATLKAFNKRHSGLGCSGVPQYSAGVIIQKRFID
jgi:hypothetical protein